MSGLVYGQTKQIMPLSKPAPATMNIEKCDKKQKQRSDEGSAKIHNVPKSTLCDCISRKISIFAFSCSAVNHNFDAEVSSKEVELTVML